MNARNSMRTCLDHSCRSSGSAASSTAVARRSGLSALQLDAESARDAEAPRSVRDTLTRAGAPLDTRVRGEFESRLGCDFSGVRVHTDAEAARSAGDIGALAYTVGNHVVFGGGRFAPGTHSGNKLLAHELTHVDQQRGAAFTGGALRIDTAGEAAAQAAESGAGRGHASRTRGFGSVPAATLQRAPNPKELEEYDRKIAEIRNFDEVKLLQGDDPGKFEDIVRFARTRDNPTYYSTRLEALFKTEKQNPNTSSRQMAEKIKKAADKEAKRLGKQSPASLNREEGVSARRNFRKQTGADGKTLFEIDDSDVTDIAVRVKVHLHPEGKGEQPDVDRVVSLADAIEKRASTGGYNFDVEFVTSMAGANNDVFSIQVDTQAWTTEGNFSGDDVSIAHELHHVLGLEQDRYDYTNHAYNKMFDISTRLYWFREEFNKKIPNHDDSMMNTGKRVPLDEDICRLALRNTDKTLDAKAKLEADLKAEEKIKACVQTRLSSRERQFKPAIDLAQAWLKQSAARKDGEMAAVADRVFSRPPKVERLREIVTFIPKYIAFSNLLPSSELDEGCGASLAFARGGTGPQIGICPDFLRAPVATRSRALVIEALHLAGIGSLSGLECALACDGGTPCGGTNNATAWAGFIQCSARP